jgi:hypothetical protein
MSAVVDHHVRCTDLPQYVTQKGAILLVADEDLRSDVLVLIAAGSMSIP